MPSEVLGWGEGQIIAWTGTASAVPVFAYAKNSNLSLVKQFDNRQMVSGNYVDRKVGQRADLDVGAFYTLNATILRFFEAETAVHMHLLHTITGQGSAGYLLYSGVLDQVTLAADEASPFVYRVTYHCNQWSAYGV